MSKKIKSTNPSVSIVTITQNSRFKCLEILYEFIKNQTYKNIIEWVITEGSKTLEDRENSANNIEGLIKKSIEENVNFKIVYITDTLSLKLGGLRNKGNTSCTGDITVCMDDDDFYFNNRVEHAVNKLVNSKYLIAGCSNHLMYDFQLNILIQMEKVADFHSINSCMAWKKEYLKNNECDPSKEFNEESSFTKNFTEPMIQLEPYSTIVTLSHTNNTYDKKHIYVHTINLQFQSYSRGNMVINKNITKYIPNEIYSKYSNIFTKKNIDEPDYDIVYMCGGLSIKWEPTDKKLGGSEQAVVNLSENWVKQGKSVIVYGEVPDIIFNGVVYKPWTKFDYQKKYKNVILWRLYGLLTFIPFGVKADNIVLDVHDNTKALQPFLEKYNNKINKIFLKSNYHKSGLLVDMKKNIDTDTIVIVPNGIRITEFNVVETNISRNPYRFCYCSCYTRGLEYILTNIWPTIYKYEPRAELHVYYGMHHVSDQNYLKHMLGLLSQPGVMDHGRQPVELVNREKHMSAYHLYITETEAEIDCISIRESLVAGCIPIISNFGVFAERDGIHIDFDTQANKNMVPVKIIQMLRDISKQEEIRESLKKSKTIVSWKQVAEEWLKHMV